ncbi:VTT domain-containing protein [Candidatus Woesearchaeota archaeon]|nr:VTT domain-containing protein [Candidatus Woesearchaeota archaeon]
MLDKVKELFILLYSLPSLISSVGYFGLFLIIFAETGLMVGFFLPGDSLLVTAGLFASKGDLNIFFLIISLCTAAILGDSTGYFIGKKAGQRLFQKEDSRFFKKKYLCKTQEFYEKYGGKTIVLARFVPIIRTFAPVIAGIAKMNYKRFLFFNIFGGTFWVTGMLLVGYFLGKLIPNIEQNIHLVIILVIVISFIPVLIEYYKTKNTVIKH